MKILFFHRWTGVHFGGTETHVTELMQRLSQRGHQVSLLTRQGTLAGSFDPKIKVYGVSKNFRESDHSYENTVSLYCHTFLFMLKSFLYLLYLRIFLGQKYEVISVHFATEAVVARLFRRLFKTPYVFVLEGYTPLEAGEAKLANSSIAISENMTGKIWENHGYRPHFLPVGIDVSRFNPKIEGFPERSKYLAGFEKLIITVGRIEPRKDYPTLVAAARIIKQKSYRYRFLIVGDGIDRDKIGQAIKSFGLAEEVLMLGAVSEDLKAKLYRACDLFVLPTLYEGFGIVFIEAMASGLPIISTEVGAVPEVVKAAGVLVEPQNPKKLAETIAKVLEDKDLCSNLSQEAINISGNYNWDKLIPKYEDVYNSVIKRASPK